jgi:hypothetical protein
MNSDGEYDGKDPAAYEGPADDQTSGKEHDAESEPARPDSRLYKKAVNFNRFIDEAGKGLSDGEFKVWCALYRFENSGLARASKKTIGERVGKSERQVARLIEGLIRKDLVKIDQHGGYKRGCNVYRLGIKRLEKAPKKARRTKTSVGPNSPQAPEVVAALSVGPFQHVRGSADEHPADRDFALKPR